MGVSWDQFVSLALAAEEPLAERPDPEVAMPVLPDYAGGVGREAALSGERRHPAVRDAGEAAARADPQSASS